MQVQHLTTRQPKVEFYLITFPRFPLGKKEYTPYFGKNGTDDFRTSRCAGYLLDHSGDFPFKKQDIIRRCSPLAVRATNPLQDCRFGLDIKNEQANAGRDGQTCLARPNSPLRTGSGRAKNIFFTQLTTSRIGDLTRLIHTLL